MPKATNSTFWNLKKTANNSAEIVIYSPIDDEESWWYDSVTPASLIRELNAAGDISEITVRINSPGGSVFAGLTIYEQLKSHKAKIITRVDGVAASAASIIFMAGDVRIMGTGGMVMAHNPWTVAVGESKDLRHTADVLDKVTASLINIYSDRTGKDEKELKKMLDKETWLTADEAVASGFADKVDRSFQVSASISDKFVVFNGQKIKISAFATVPNLPKAEDEELEYQPEGQETPAAEPENPVVTPETNEKNDENEHESAEGDDDSVKDIEELQAKHPAIYQAALKAGAENERNRIKSLDELLMPGNEDLINKAKFETGATVAETAVEILKAENAKRKEMGNKTMADANKSNVNSLSTSAAPQDEQTDAEKEDQEAQIVSNGIINQMKRMRGAQ
ncbi:head maturation protease, ClpP-related [Paenibacillus sp. NRS-1760]|uniref:head maturation protease, ClpP-related n=1 Tax=Paenibacillus sp. NRS-1760 TaxID=3233902 RepID=UPI003D279F79